MTTKKGGPANPKDQWTSFGDRTSVPPRFTWTVVSETRGPTHAGSGSTLVAKASMAQRSSPSVPMAEETSRE